MQNLDIISTPLPTNSSKDKLHILVCPPNSGGCAYYRSLSPFKKLAELYPDQIEVVFESNPLEMDVSSGKLDPNVKLEKMNWADIIVGNNISNFGGPYTAEICRRARLLNKFFHFDTDDLLTDLYEGHRLKQVYEQHKLYDLTKFIYANSILVTVTQNKFLDRIKEFCGAYATVLKNCIDYDLPGWNAPKNPPYKKGLVRVGWAGGIHHEEDVKEFAGVPYLVNQKVGKENVTWNFYGKPPIDPNKKEDQWQHDVWKNYERIIMSGFRGAKNYGIFPALPTDSYGIIYANVDIAIAPLQMNAFNDSKSDIKVAECGRYKVPLIASDVGCYRETIVNGKTGFLIPPDAPKTEWIRILNLVIRDHKLRTTMGENLHKITEEKFNLNKMVKLRLQLYSQLFEQMPNDFKQNLKINHHWRFKE